MTHFWLDDKRRADFLNRVEMLAPKLSAETRSKLALEALKVEKFEDWPDEFGRAVGVDPATSDGVDVAIRRINAYFVILRGSGEMPDEIKTEDVVSELVLSDDMLPEARVVTWTNLQVNGVPINATARWGCSLSTAILLHVRELRVVVEDPDVKTMDICDRNGTPIRRVKGEQDKPPVREAAQEPERPQAAAPTKSTTAQTGNAPASKGQVHPFVKIRKETLGQNQIIGFYNDQGKRVGHVWFPKDASKPSKVWRELEEGTMRDWHSAEIGAELSAEGSVTLMPGDKLDRDGNPYMNVVRVTLK